VITTVIPLKMKVPLDVVSKSNTTFLKSFSLVQLLIGSEFRVYVKHWSSSGARIRSVHLARMAHIYLAASFFPTGDV